MKAALNVLTHQLCCCELNLAKYKTITNMSLYQQERGGLHPSLSARKSGSRFYWLDELPVGTAGETGAVVGNLPDGLSAL